MDIFENKAALAESIIGESLDAILTKDLDGTIKSWNPASEKLYGFRAEEIIGKKASILYSKERQKEEEEILEKISKGIRIEPFPTKRIRKDGKEFDVMWTVSPLKNKDGEIIGASSISRDITELKEAERKQARFIICYYTLFPRRYYNKRFRQHHNKLEFFC